VVAGYNLRPVSWLLSPQTGSSSPDPLSQAYANHVFEKRDGVGFAAG
jgi:hypothetical protein